ncbi:MAG: 4-alpha-glucanotransferase [Betaproteobacteria bacterium RIFCSPLOWO2_12_FULL_62_13]|nr:MAG: 4-alpha-glucanotransferase [Betaproteobacteria bacterium RIFCSPLOWO2_12_FULL_62_13]
MPETALDRLCELAGIAAEFADIWGKTHRPSNDTRVALLKAMGMIADASEVEAALTTREEERWRSGLPPVAVFRELAAPYRVPLCMAEGQAGATHRWMLALESGEVRSGEFVPAQLPRLRERDAGETRHAAFAFEWRERLPLGYHRFTLRRPGEAGGLAMTLVVAPERCYVPAALEGEGRVWGPALQLYSVRSERNWGIGDFTDLRTVVQQWGHRGAGIVGVNPLHALYPRNPAHASSYSPSSRLFLNVLYVDIDAVEDLRECVDETRVHSGEMQTRLKALRDLELVDYSGVVTAKLPVLEQLYGHFRANHLDACSVRAREFREFQARGGPRLRGHALFEALHERFRAEDPGAWGWPVWPEEFRDPASQEVARFAQAQLDRVEFYEYLQWQADLQLGQVARRCYESQLGVGLYRDLAVSIDRGGAEAWANQDLYAIEASIGAPPDDFNLSGQNWGLPPMRPETLRAAGYEPFIATLRANMRHAGALRIDHVMGLARLFWIPPGGRPADGAYVRYFFDDLLGIVALESHRNQCLVIGEDLGTVPDEVRAALARSGVLSCRLLYFERSPAGEFKAPSEYPADALVAATTHDLPTLAGYWEGHDLNLRHELGLFPTEEARQRQVIARAQDRARLLLALEREHLLPQAASANPVSLPVMTPEFMLAVHEFLARTRARVLMVQLEDLLGEREQTNLPGTTDQHPNWRRKLPLPLERVERDPRFAALAQALARTRPRARPLPPHDAARAATRIPRATYRLQLNREFTFNQAAAIVPYLAELGMSHVYCSPYLRARAGSAHGYDIIDHHALNPEIGSRQDFEHFVAVLRRHGMGQIFDMVPNHMGVMGADNTWWLDVLENGLSSTYASFFDIDWLPANTELANKVLVPVLADHYGSVLERGELRLEFDSAAGSFSVLYHEHRFPIDPCEYPRILACALGATEPRGCAEATRDELSSLSAAFGHLPVRHDTAPAHVAERQRDKELLKRRLARLVARAPEIGEAMARALQRLNGSPGERASFEALHELLDSQAYRLAYWRVASDEINYRRFFDINALAALRMESEAVFETTHRLALELAVAGKIDGLRIDHPDGLYDPEQYFRRLQERYAQLSGVELIFPQEGRPARPLYVVAEKITAHHESVPETWAVHGTTGYRFAAVVNGLFVDASAKRRFDRIYRAFVQDAVDFDEVAYNAKATIMRSALASELTVLTTELLRVAHADRRTRDYTFNTLRRALAEVVACFPVYRTYIADKISAQDRRYVDWAIGQARRRSRDADFTVFEFVRSVLLGQAPDDAPPELRTRCRAFAMKFQQFTAPVAAKGVEDTALYRYNRLLSLNEVGGDPRAFGISLPAFHQASLDRARNWPHTILATSTHDCKRSEDVRMRINALSEMPMEWAAKLRRWRRLNRDKKRSVEDQPAPSANDEYLLYQTLVGTWPLQDPDAQALDAYHQRIERFLLKAAREAKVHTSWMNVNEEYEAAVTAFVVELLHAPERNPFLADFVPFARRIARIGMFNSLSQLVIKVASPGVPDFYQGGELWQFHLVDPDNRAPVDYTLRQRMLGDLKRHLDALPEHRAGRARALLDRLEDGRAKLFATWKSLTTRREQRALFASGEYLPLESAGAHAERLCAFARVAADAALIVIAPRLMAKLIGASDSPLGREKWSDTKVILPGRIAGRYRNIFTAEAVRCSETCEIAVAEALSNFPVALLLRNELEKA